MNSTKNYIIIKSEDSRGNETNLIFGGSTTINDLFQIFREEDGQSIKSMGAVQVFNPSTNFNPASLSKYADMYVRPRDAEQRQILGKGLMAFFE